MNNMQNRIVLTGFRATGKSTLGQLVAERLGYSFLDTDHELTCQLGTTIAQTVARHGWSFFRRAEAQLLRELSELYHVVISTGGGAVEHHSEWQLLRRNSFVVWLDADVDTINQRITADAASAAQRPALLNGRTPQDEIAQLLRQRTPLYAAGSDLRLDTANVHLEDLAAQLCAAYRGGSEGEHNEASREERLTGMRET